MNHERIVKYLEQQKVPFSLAGFNYLACAIMFAYENGSPLQMMGIYEQVADLTGDKPTAIERTMRYAIGKTGQKVHVKEFIARALHHLENAEVK